MESYILANRKFEEMLYDIKLAKKEMLIIGLNNSY